MGERGQTYVRSPNNEEFESVILTKVKNSITDAVLGIGDRIKKIISRFLSYKIPNFIFLSCLYWPNGLSL